MAAPHLLCKKERVDVYGEETFWANPVMGCENRLKFGKILTSLRTNGVQEKLYKILKGACYNE